MKPDADINCDNVFLVTHSILSSMTHLSTCIHFHSLQTRVSHCTISIIQAIHLVTYDAGNNTGFTCKWTLWVHIMMPDSVQRNQSKLITLCSEIFTVFCSAKNLIFWTFFLYCFFTIEIKTNMQLI